LQDFSETQDAEAVVRSKMDNGQTIKVRRRVTAALRNAQASVVVAGSEVALWRTWYNTNCQGGVLPTRFIMPMGNEEIWRFSTPLTIVWQTADRSAAIISFSLEQLPYWNAP
jgi:hypothetical protein